MKYRYSIILSLFTFLFSADAWGQNTPNRLITVNFDSVKIDGFVKQLESQTGYIYYYNIQDFDSITFSLNVKDQSLENVLTQAFANKDLFFSMNASNHVFLTKAKRVKTALPEGFFTTGTAKQPQSTDAGLVNGEDGNKPAQKSSLENKLYVIGDRNQANSPGNAILDGYARDAKTGEPVVGASVYLEKLKVGTVTDQFGYYSISIPKGQHTISIQSVGIKDTKRQIMLNSDGKIDLELQTQVTTLKNVVLSAQKMNNIKNTQMGVQKIDIKTIKQVPVVFGEADILKVVLTLPGVKSVGEASTGLNVRGGAADQNLILFNDATIYNPSHFFGLFSAFNPELVKDVELYKSSIPAKFGGRLSSVIDINSREGNKKKLTGSAGIGLLTSRFNLEGPLVKNKSSFLLGVRTTYAKWLLDILPAQYKNSRASFNDVNLNITHEFNKKNTLYLTGYLSNDRFNLNSDTFYTYGNRNISLKLKHVFNNKLNALLTAGYDRYQYKISSDQNPVNAYQLGFDINQTYGKLHFNYYASLKHKIEFGINTILYKLHPGFYEPVGAKSLVAADTVATEQALESALYISDKYAITSALTLDAGIRFSIFNYRGPQNIHTYGAGIPRTADNMLATVPYSKGDFIKTYGAPEYRVSMRYAFSDSFSIKAAYNTQQQYIHSISNITSMAPTDIWKLSDPNIKPQSGDQVSLGLYKNLRANTIEASIEVYYKNIHNYLDYKSGAVLIMNHHVETEVINTKGKAYGIEILIKKLTGKINGWISYTYSRTLLKMDDPIAGELINKGNFYPANYDKPHDITIIGNYRVSHRFSVSLNATYSTGRPITLPVGNFYYARCALCTQTEMPTAYRIISVPIFQ